MNKPERGKPEKVDPKDLIKKADPNRDTELYGGQAVLEGVMMKGKNRAVVSCRAPNGQIMSKVIFDDPTVKVAKGVRSIPFLRGFFILIDSMTLGFKALSFSSDIAMMEEKKEAEKQSNPGDEPTEPGI